MTDTIHTEGTLTTAGAELLRAARDRMTPENFAWEHWGQGDNRPCCIAGHINKVLDARGEPSCSIGDGPHRVVQALGFRTYTPAVSQLFTGWKRASPESCEPAPGALNDVIHATDSINLFLLAHGHPIDVIDVPVPEEQFCFV